MLLQSFYAIDGVTPLTMSNFGILGYGTNQPAEGTQEEQISWSGVINNADGSAQLTGIESVLDIYPYTASTGFSQNHGWGTNFVVSNTAGFYNTFANKENDGTITGSWVFAAFASGANPKIDSNSYIFTSLDYITLGAVDTILTGYLLTNGTNSMLANLNMNSHRIVNVTNPTSNQDAATKIYVDNSVIAGGVPAVPGTPGIVNIATTAQFNANTNTQTISSLVYYNMATVQQVNSVGSAQFVYGESITLNDYVFQATGNETGTGAPYTAGRVYRVDVTNIGNIGPYKGFALATAGAGTTNAVQINNIVSGFTGLTLSTNVYINPSVAGGITQTAGLTTGRAIGIAISATQIQITNMRVRDISYALSTNISYTLNQDGFIMGTTDNNAAGSVTENGTTVVSWNPLSTGVTMPFCVAVKAGYQYRIVSGGSIATAAFYPLING